MHVHIIILFNRAKYFADIFILQWDRLFGDQLICAASYMIPITGISTEYKSIVNHAAPKYQIVIDQVLNYAKLINMIMEPFTHFLIIPLLYS